jgi:parvulin-like peptidyl-prolyl isomerase
MKLLREPLVHFMFIGAVIYLLYGAFAEPAPEADDKTIVVSAGEVEWMQTAWQKRWSRPPTTTELDGLMQQYIRETVLYREALTMGLNKHDQVIRRRLAQKLEFLAKDLVALTPPSEEDLHSYFEEHKKRYQQPALYTFTQVFIDPDKRSDATLDDAQKIKAQLIARGDDFGDAGALGDSFMLQNYYPQKDQAEIQKQFGSGFADSLVALSPGQWHGPVLSGYGVHLVYVHHREDTPDPEFESVKEDVRRDWISDRQRELQEEYVNNVIATYEVEIEEGAWDGDLPLTPEQAE